MGTVSLTGIHILSCFVCSELSLTGNRTVPMHVMYKYMLSRAILHSHSIFFLDDRFYVFFVLIFIRRIISISMLRKPKVCHLCGVATQRLSDHLRLKHGCSDVDNQLKCREDWVMRVTQAAFTDTTSLLNGLQQASSSTDQLKFSVDEIASFLTEKGWKVVQPRDAAPVAPSSSTTVAQFGAADVERQTSDETLLAEVISIVLIV